MNYETWRISFQSSEQAARSAFNLWRSAQEKLETTPQEGFPADHDPNNSIYEVSHAE